MHAYTGQTAVQTAKFRVPTILTDFNVLTKLVTEGRLNQYSEGLVVQNTTIIIALSFCNVGGPFSNV